MGILKKRNQCVPGNSDLFSNADTFEHATVNQRIGGIAANMKNGHQVLHGHHGGEIIIGVIFSFQRDALP